jgi:hypothetical protein
MARQKITKHKNSQEKYKKIKKFQKFNKLSNLFLFMVVHNYEGTLCYFMLSFFDHNQVFILSVIHFITLKIENNNFSIYTK